MRSLPGGVQAPQARDPPGGTGGGLGERLAALEQEDQQEVHQPHGVQHAALVSPQSRLHGVRQRRAEQVLKERGQTRPPSGLPGLSGPLGPLEPLGPLGS